LFRCEWLQVRSGHCCYLQARPTRHAEVGTCSPGTQVRSTCRKSRTWSDSHSPHEVATKSPAWSPAMPPQVLSPAPPAARIVSVTGSVGFEWCRMPMATKFLFMACGAAVLTQCSFLALCNVPPPGRSHRAQHHRVEMAMWLWQSSQQGHSSLAAARCRCQLFDCWPLRGAAMMIHDPFSLSPAAGVNCCRSTGQQR
jgi:hypothetical protein